MLSSLFVSLLLGSLALASPLSKPYPVIPRQASSNATQPATQQLINQINTVESNIASLNNTLNGFQPDAILGAPKALVIQFQTDALGQSLNKATEIVNSAQTFNAADSATVAQAVIGLQPQIASLLNNIVVHKPSFATVLFLLDLSQTVENDLITQKGESNEFGTALAGKLSGIFATAAPTINAQIQQYFTTAIAAYSACTGVVCLPPISL